MFQSQQERRKQAETQIVGQNLPVSKFSSQSKLSEQQAQN